MQRYGRPLPFTPWHRLEVRNAIRLAMFQNVIGPDQGKAQLRQMDQDLKEETIITHQAIDWTDVLRKAEKLGATHNTIVGCRSADLFHVAAASELACDQFLTFDERQIAMAKAAGLAVKL